VRHIPLLGSRLIAGGDQDDPNMMGACQDGGKGCAKSGGVFVITSFLPVSGD
jgi:hypothetical protein